MGKKREIITLQDSNFKNIDLTMDDWTFQFSPTKWRKVYPSEHSDYSELEPINERQDGTLIILRETDDLSIQLFNAQLRGEKFQTATVKYYLDEAARRKSMKPPLAVVFHDISIVNLQKKRGIDKLTFSFEKTSGILFPEIRKKMIRFFLFQ